MLSVCVYMKMKTVFKQVFSNQQKNVVSALQAGIEITQFRFKFQTLNEVLQELILLCYK